MDPTWLSTDEGDDVAGSVRHALRSAKFIADDPQAWKWVALALHSALQGGCVCHLTTTAPPLGAVSRRNAVEWLVYHEELRNGGNPQPPRAWLMELPDLLKAVRKPGSAGHGSNETGIAVSDTELNWLRRFHQTVRNQFVHFEPIGWSLELSGIPSIAAVTARILADIADLGWAFRHKNDDWQAAFRDHLERLSNWAANDRNGVGPGHDRHGWERDINSTDLSLA